MNASLAPCALAGDPLATTVCEQRNVFGAFERFFCAGNRPFADFHQPQPVFWFQPRPSDKSDRSDRSDKATVFLSAARRRDSVTNLFVFFVYFVVSNWQRQFHLSSFIFHHSSGLLAIPRSPCYITM